MGLDFDEWCIVIITLCLMLGIYNLGMGGAVF